MSLKSYDFRCTRCAHEFEDLSSYSETLQTVEPVPCAKCAAPSNHFWKHGTRLNMRPDELSEADAKTAHAMLGKKVTSRSEADKLSEELGLIRTNKQQFDRLVEERAFDSDPEPEERELSKDEVDAYRALIHERTQRIKVASDHGDIPQEGSISDLPAAVRAEVGL